MLLKSQTAPQQPPTPNVQRISDLTKRQHELEERVLARNQSSVALTKLTRELDQLQAVASLQRGVVELRAVQPRPG